MTNSPSVLVSKLIFACFKTMRNICFSILQLFGKSRRSVINAFLYGFIRPIWNLLPQSLSRITIVSKKDQFNVKFRPFILHDFLFVLSNHEPFFKELFHPKRDSIVVDVGAHIGLYTIKAASLVGPKGKVVSVEPDFRNFALLKENIKLNNLNNVIPVNAALSDFHGEKLFYPCIDPSLSGLRPSSESRVCEPKLTKILTLDELLKNFDIYTINWLKIDVEGEELRVLQGGLNTLQNSKRVNVLVESDNDTCAKLLEHKGFIVKYLGEIYYFASK